MLKQAFLYLASIFIFISQIPLASAQDQSTQLFEQLKNRVFQVKVIDIASGNKSSIGSGFLVANDHLIATNYHVVSSYLLNPEKYKLVLLDNQQQSQELAIVDFDIIHDLALLKTKALPYKPLVIETSQPAKGNRIYSMGNPHDLGMTIIEGTYNGLVEGSRYQKYLFSGSLNPGMSGGPAFNSRGEIIGINVSKGGEQISFLVPAFHLADLIKRYRQNGEIAQADYNSHIYAALYADQDAYYQHILNLDWSTTSFMNYDLPDKIDSSLKCWGHIKSKDKDLYKNVHRHCRTEDRVYLDNNFYTGGFSYDYSHFSTEQLNTIRFYNLLQSRHNISGFYNGNKEDASNFVCTSNYITLNDSEWKATTCAREYLNYKGLYDASLIATRVDQYKESLHLSIRMIGISQHNLLNISDRFLELVSWKK
ncbi:serine protease [Dasania sp. GY-MA-18]|uniref:Serine protease n=1 Tax=Dasania phycosphaerae TaxID=2950436 RepID=A0A9J6RQ09_9GAMM|nr:MULTISPECIES: serine protease [Dasania]MCR8923822.1 serine protease [Dasania sp. GY-MA-18]MCZ0866256.1 serine protease [Dasania phycosphaerae]MCZ0869980.1 serine protease [Dasania phycosphaerae]